LHFITDLLVPLPAAMGRIIAIDYGKKRTGIAVTDPMKLIAGGLTTLSSPEAVPYIKEYMTRENVELILLGEPRKMNYEPSENMQRVLVFKEKLMRAIPAVNIKMIDERFTSSLAHQAMLQGGLKKKDRRNKELVDELSAVILLQSYLETIRI
jgi:putative Holliday junction resolvase